MKYKKKQRKNPQDTAAAGKFYAAPVNSGKITLHELSARIERNSFLLRRFNIARVDGNPSLSIVVKSTND